VSVVSAEIGGLSAPPLAAGALGHLQRLVGPSGLHVVDYCGVVQGGLANAPTQMQRVRYVGTGTNFRYLADLLFSSFQVVNTARHGPGIAASRAREHEADILLTDLPPIWRVAGPLLAQIRVPAWIRQEIAVAFGQRLLPRAVDSEVRRLTRKYRLSVDFARSSVLVRRFYHEFYVPYVTTRFGPQAIVVDEATFMQRAGEKWLARVFTGGEWTAGMLIEQGPAVMRFGWFGARSYPAPCGASEVLDAACVRRAGTLGLKRVLMGHSRPSLVDGVLRYKSHFGAALRPTRFPQDLLGISFATAHDALLARVNDLQLIRFRNGKPLAHRVERRAGTVKVDLTAVSA
jgi:hypothetical protein